MNRRELIRAVAAQTDQDVKEVEAFLNGAFELQGEDGEHYHRVNDRHLFVLERTTNNKWRFLTGM